MGLSRLFCCFAANDQSVPQRILDGDQEDVKHSHACTVFNSLGLKETGYIDERRLNNALTNMFAAHGILDFGITVCRIRSTLLLAGRLTR